MRQLTLNESIETAGGFADAAAVCVFNGVMPALLTTGLVVAGTVAIAGVATYGAYQYLSAPTAE